MVPLRQILETQGLRGIQFEGDFLPRILEGVVDPDLLATYKGFLRRDQARCAAPAGLTDRADEPRPNDR